MKKTNYYQLLLLSGMLLLAACANNAAKESERQNTIAQAEQGKATLPKGTYPVIYLNHLYLQTKIDSASGNFVFDSGADRLYIDSVFYAQEGLSHDNIALARLPGVGEQMQTLPLILDPVQASFLGQKISTKQTPVIRLKPILGDLADGIIGQQLLAGRIMEISYMKEYIKLYESMDSIDQDAYCKIDCELEKNRLYIPLEVKINDRVCIKDRFLLDLGSGGSIGLTSHAAQEYQLDKIITEKCLYHTIQGGIGGNSSSYDFIAESLGIGSFQLFDVHMDYSLDKKGALASDRYAGLLGNKILDRFDIILDLQEPALYLKPNSDFDRAFEPPRAGFTYVDRSNSLGYWVVKGLWEGSPAEESGLQFNHRITHVNGTAVKEIDERMQKQLFKTGSQAKLTIRGKHGPETMQFALEPILKK